MKWQKNEDKIWIEKIEIKFEEQKKKLKKNDHILRDLPDNIKHSKIHIMEVPKEEDREKKRYKKYLKKLSEISQNLMKTIN